MPSPNEASFDEAFHAEVARDSRGAEAVLAESVPKSAENIHVSLNEVVTACVGFVDHAGHALWSPNAQTHKVVVSSDEHTVKTPSFSFSMLAPEAHMKNRTSTAPKPTWSVSCDKNDLSYAVDLESGVQTKESTPAFATDTARSNSKESAKLRTEAQRDVAADSQVHGRGLAPSKCHTNPSEENVKTIDVYDNQKSQQAPRVGGRRRSVLGPNDEAVAKDEDQNAPCFPEQHALSAVLSSAALSRDPSRIDLEACKQPDSDLESNSVRFGPPFATDNSTVIAKLSDDIYSEAGRSCENEILHEGWVRKRGQVNKAFKERYFVLTTGVLKYYLSHEDYVAQRPEQNSLDCLGLRVEAPPGGEGSKADDGEDVCDTKKELTFVLTSAGGKRVVCQVGSGNECKEWVRHVKAAASESYARKWGQKSHLNLKPRRGSMQTMLRLRTGNGDGSEGRRGSRTRRRGSMELLGDMSSALASGANSALKRAGRRLSVAIGLEPNLKRPATTRRPNRAVGSEMQALLCMVPGGDGLTISRKQYLEMLKTDMKRLKLGSWDLQTMNHIVEAVFGELASLDIFAFEQLLARLRLPLGSLAQRNEEEFVEQVFEEADTDLSGTIDFAEFQKMGMHVHKSVQELEMLFHQLDVDNSGALDLGEFLKYKAVQVGDGQECEQEEDLPLSKRLENALEHLHNQVFEDNGKRVWACVYVGSNCVLGGYVYFSRKGWLTGSQPRVVGALDGELVNMARVFGMLLNLNCALVLIPMLRAILTRLQSTWLTSYVPFDKAYDAHQLVGAVTFALSLAHALFHTLNLILWDGWTLKGSLWCGNKEDGFLHCSAVSGIILQAVFSVMMAFSLPYFRKSQRFQWFWSMHHLVIIFYAVLLWHGRVFWKWFLPVLGTYLVDRFLRRRTASFPAKVQFTKAKGDKVMQIQFAKPPGLNYHAGQYVFLKSAVITKYEWHPFTLTSCPEDNYLECHIKAVGDWTESLHEHYDALAVVDGVPAYRLPSHLLHVDGPHGAPSQDWSQYSNVVLISAGIGVTPFASIIKHLQFRMEQCNALEAAGLRVPPVLSIQTKKVYFIWICRSKESLAWFTEIIAKTKQQLGNKFEVQVYLSSVSALGDVTAALMHIGLHAYFHEHKRDVITGLDTLTQYDKPRWRSIFSSLARQHKNEKVGVFFCGPPGLGKTLRNECIQATASTTTTFSFAKENF